MKTKIYQRISSILNAIDNCRESGNDTWLEKHESALEWLIDQLPTGSGIDAGIELDREKSTPEKLIFNFGFHHMDENGYYDGWTEHTLTIRPSLQFGIDIKISGRDRNHIKDYLYDLFNHAISAVVWQEPDSSWHIEYPK